MKKLFGCLGIVVGSWIIVGATGWGIIKLGILLWNYSF